MEGTGDELASAVRQRKLEGRVDDVQLTHMPYNSPYLLNVACETGNTSCVRALLDLGASPLTQTVGISCDLQLEYELDYHISTGKETCLHLAAKADSDESVRMLLDAGADIEARSANQSTPLMYAAQRLALSRRGQCQQLATDQ